MKKEVKEKKKEFLTLNLSTWKLVATSKYQSLYEKFDWICAFNTNAIKRNKNDEPYIILSTKNKFRLTNVWQGHVREKIVGAESLVFFSNSKIGLFYAKDS